MPNIFIKEPEHKMWGSFIETRTPQSKVHSRLSDAKNAIGVKWPNCGGIIYQNIDGEWKEIFRIDTPISCAKCFNEFKYPKSKWNSDKHTINYMDKVLDRTVVCGECYSKHWGYRAPKRLSQDWKPNVQL